MLYSREDGCSIPTGAGAEDDAGCSWGSAIFNSASSVCSFRAKTVSGHWAGTGGGFLFGVEADDLPLDLMPRVPAESQSV